MKNISQLLFKLTTKDYERFGDILPYAWISFNPHDLDTYSKEVLVFYSIEDYNNNKGTISYISDDIHNDIFLYECKPLT